MSAPLFLYRAYDADGALLYLGLTHQINARMANHRCTSKWWSEHARIETFELPTTDRRDAEAMEESAILLEQPKYNVKGKEMRLPIISIEERDALGYVAPREATQLANLKGIRWPEWQRYIRPAARCGGTEVYDPEYCRRMAIKSDAFGIVPKWANRLQREVAA